jgi:bifunctional UDP-N-acetylglucosamine pyrophosphorylase/glucosamine-1-phosphate N-acetyltransferase
LFEVKNFLFGKIRRNISKKANISKTSNIIGPVVIDDGATIDEYAVVKGPCYIGKNTFIGTSTLVRDGSDIEQDCVVGAYMEIKNSIILSGSKTHSGFLGDSIVGRNSRIAALFSSANVRLDRATVKVEFKGKKVDSDLKSLGVIIGDGVIIGSRVSTMPGVVIGSNSSIGPSTTVMKNVPADTIFYTKFKEIIEKNKTAQK